MLRISIEELYKQELEFYTHKISEGDFTPLVFELLKNTSDMEGLLEFLGYKKEETKTCKEVVTIGDTFDTLFKNGVEVV